MALQTGTLFKNFIFRAAASAQVSPYQFIAAKEGEKAIAGVKFDNLTSSCTILVHENDFTGIDSIYDYKYFTIDNSNVFEVTNCRQVGELYVLNLSFVSNFDFSNADKDLIISGLSAETLIDLGLDLNTFLSVVGEKNFTDMNPLFFDMYSDGNAALPEQLFWAVKISFSQYPQNLIRICTSGGFMTNGTSPTVLSSLPTRLYNPVRPSDNLTFMNYKSAALFSDENSVFVLFPRTTEKMTIFINGAQTSTGYSYTINDFLDCLKKLISDLTVSIQLTLISEKTFSFVTFSNGNYYAAQMRANTNTDVIISFPTVTTNVDIGDMIRCLDNNLTPLFITKNSASNKTTGIYEYYDFIELPSPIKKNSAGKIINIAFFMTIAGNIIDVSNCKNKIYFKRQKDSARIYINFYENDFVDLPLSLEFNQTAFSNYESYKKANLDAEFFAQQRELKQNQINTAINNIIASLFGSFNSTANAVYSAGAAVTSGDIGGMFSAGMSRFMNGVQSVEQSIALSAQQEQERKKLALQQSNQREIERTKIVPTQKINGAVSFSDLKRGIVTTTYQPVCMFFSYCCPILQNEIRLALTDYVLKNRLITKKIRPITLYKNPEWTVDYYFENIKTFWIELTNINPQSTRQGGIVLGRFE